MFVDLDAISLSNYNKPVDIPVTFFFWVHTKQFVQEFV